MQRALKCEIMRPSALGVAELDAWRQFMRQSTHLQRAFFTPEFAIACERAQRRAHVAVLHDGSGIQGFLAFEFQSIWHQRVRLAERIGGNLAQGACLVARPGLRIDSAQLLRRCGLGAMQVTQLMQGQEAFGLDAEWSQEGCFTDLRNGTDAYFAALLQRDRLLVRDTERRLRKAEKTYGALCYSTPEAITADLIADLITSKREQYSRTQVADPFVNPDNARLIAVLNTMPVPDCRLVMHRLVGGDRVLAQHLGLQYQDVLSHWFPVYDTEARSVSPGRLLLWKMIEQAREAGVGIIDYGEGAALYKRELATGSLRYGRALWLCGGVRSAVAHLFQAAEWRMGAYRRNQLKQPATQGS